MQLACPHDRNTLCCFLPTKLKVDHQETTVGEVNRWSRVKLLRENSVICVTHPTKELWQHSVPLISRLKSYRWPFYLCIDFNARVLKDYSEGWSNHLHWVWHANLASFTRWMIGWSAIKISDPILKLINKIMRGAFLPSTSLLFSNWRDILKSKLSAWSCVTTFVNKTFMPAVWRFYQLGVKWSCSEMQSVQANGFTWWQWPSFL